MEYTENKILPERALLVALDTGEYDAESSLDELWELAKSGGAEPVATLTQKRPAPETATCVGSGMVQEIRTFCEDNAIELIIFDRELTPTQIRNLEKETDVRVVDRTMLILDIFAQRAQSRAGKVQVEMAQLKYMLPRLSGKGAALSRLGGGIGTRGPGETKLETDRRHIRRRIESLREQLKKVETGRKETQRRREKDGTVTVALVGYTNAGKSTLMNLLTQAGVRAEDIDEVYLACGFGTRLDIMSAAKAGLIAPELAGKTRGIGNAALDGAQRALCTPGGFERLTEIQGRCEYVELSGSAEFSEAFVDAMPFYDDEEEA